MDAIFTVFLGGVLLNNYALMHFLGISTVLGNERPVKKTCCLGLSITAVMVLATLITWPCSLKRFRFRYTVPMDRSGISAFRSA